MQRRNKSKKYIIVKINKVMPLIASVKTLIKYNNCIIVKKIDMMLEKWYLLMPE